MFHPFRLPLTLLVLTGLMSAAGAARAAQSYDACEGHFIESLPVVINTQGVWCLRHDLTTAITSGGAITIAAHNVTIDCNDFKIGGLAGGVATMARGIDAHDRSNVTVRNCTIRGFHSGVYIDASARDKTGGHVIQDNRFTDNTRYGIHVDGDGSVIEHNKVLETGGSTSNPGAAVAISAGWDIDVLDNLVSNVSSVVNGSGNASAYGIQVDTNAGTIAGNRVRNLAYQGTGGLAIGIFVYNSLNQRTNIHDNDVNGPGAAGAGEYGVYCQSAQAVTHGNTIGGFLNPLSTCTDGGNFAGP
jgi:nitrous oxidase accessory protein NosD